MERYAYFIYSLLFLSVLLTILWHRTDLRKKSWSAILWGSIGGPIIEFVYFHDYWRPHTLLGKGRISIEDAIFGASIAAIAFVLYPFLSHQGLGESKFTTRQQLRRIVSYGFLGIIIFIVLYGWLHINSVFVTTIFFIIAWTTISFQRRDLLKPGLIVGTVFALAALTLYGVAFSVFGTGHLQSDWLLFGTHIGWLLFGRIPLTELIWFFATGSFLAIFDLYTSGKVYQKLE